MHIIAKDLVTCSHHRSTRIWRWPGHLHRPIGAPHRYATTISIWIRRTPRELRNAIARRHCRSIKHGGAIRGSTPTKVHRWRRPWAHVTPWCGVVGRSLHRLLHGLLNSKATATRGKCKSASDKRKYSQVHYTQSKTWITRGKNRYVPCDLLAWTGCSCACCKWCGRRSWHSCSWGKPSRPHAGCLRHVFLSPGKGKPTQPQLRYQTWQKTRRRRGNLPSVRARFPADWLRLSTCKPTHEFVRPGGCLGFTREIDEHSTESPNPATPASF